MNKQTEMQFSFDHANAAFDNYIDDMDACQTLESNLPLA